MYKRGDTEIAKTQPPITKKRVLSKSIEGGTRVNRVY